MICPQCLIWQPTSASNGCASCGAGVSTFSNPGITGESMKEAIERMQAIREERMTDEAKLLRAIAALTPEHRAEIAQYLSVCGTSLPDGWREYAEPRDLFKAPEELVTFKWPLNWSLR